MNFHGIGIYEIILVSLNLILLLAWPVASIIALIGLRQRQLEEIPRAIWAVLIVIVPLLGAIAFLIVQPGESEPSDT